MFNIWLPLPNYKGSVETLSDEHLSDQRFQILELLEYFHDPEVSQLPYDYEKHTLRDHPIGNMWGGYELQLCEYGFQVSEEYAHRKHMTHEPFYDKFYWHMVWGNYPEASTNRPNWFGDVDFHLSHQSALLRMDRDHYSHFFLSGTEDRSLIWPESDLAT